MELQSETIRTRRNPIPSCTVPADMKGASSRTTHHAPIDIKV